MNLNDLTALYDFSGQTVVLTGGSGVLGAELASALAGCNANVVLLARHMEAAQQVLDRFPRHATARAMCIYADVLDPPTLRQASETIKTEFGVVDCLVNAAGGNHPWATTTAEVSFFDLPVEALRHVGDLNLLGTLLPCQVFGRDMAERGTGVILNISSMNAFRPLTRIPAYSASKAAVTNFTQWLAVHMAQNYSARIRVNAIAPGFFVGEQNRRLLLNEDGSLTPRGEQIVAHTPQGRFGTPGDLVGTLLWLLSPASAFVTGIVVPVDGGFSAFSGV